MLSTSAGESVPEPQLESVLRSSAGESVLRAPEPHSVGCDRPPKAPSGAAAAPGCVAQPGAGRASPKGARAAGCGATEAARADTWSHAARTRRRRVRACH